jgi:hypothetical protein
VSLLPPPPLPKPASLRRVSKAPSPRASPPLGVGAWSGEDAEGVVVVLTPPGLGRTPTIEEAVLEVPPPSSLAGGTLVVVLPHLETGQGLLGRLLSRRRGKTLVARSVRCGALLLSGYERIGGGVDPKEGDDLAWGYAPAR